MIEIEHDLLEFAFWHLPVTDAEIGFGYELRKAIFDACNVFDSVVNEIDLAATLDFSETGFTDNNVVPFTDEGADG